MKVNKYYFTHYYYVKTHVTSILLSNLCSIVVRNDQLVVVVIKNALNSKVICKRGNRTTHNEQTKIIVG